MLFDTHCHLNDPDLINNKDVLIKNAHDNGVKYMCVIGYDLKSSIDAVNIAKENDNVFAAVGIIPNEILRAKKDDLKQIEELLKEDKVVAIGEIGLDYYNQENVDHDLQKKFFEEQIKLAYKYEKPIIVHSRDAANDTYELLKNNKEYLTTGIIHCFSYSLEMAEKFIDLGFYISLSGTVTFKNAKEPKRVAENIPLDKLLVETDAPYLTPVPYRGKLNEPSYVRFTAECIADIKNMDKEELANITLNNAKKVYGIQNGED